MYVVCLNAAHNIIMYSRIVRTGSDIFQRSLSFERERVDGHYTHTHIYIYIYYIRYWIGFYSVVREHILLLLL